jgi:hypothetical protein
MIGIRPLDPSGLRGFFLGGGVETVRESLSFFLIGRACPGSPYNHPISPQCGIYLFLKEGAAEIAA